MPALVTGVAGFIGSTLADRLSTEGWEVSGADRFTSYHEESAKRANLAAASASPAFRLIEADLLTVDLRPILDGIDVVIHLAAQPGVRLSWADGFRLYNDLNVNLTQRLLEAVRPTGIDRFVYASNSSVYGDAAVVPTDENQPTRPYSPYGVNQVGGRAVVLGVRGQLRRADDEPEVLHRLRPAPATRHGHPSHDRGDARGLPLLIVRRRQADSRVHLRRRCRRRHGGGRHRENRTRQGFNVAGGGSVALVGLLELVGDAIGSTVEIDWQDAQPGDMRATGGAIERARTLLDRKPETDLATGVATKSPGIASAARFDAGQSRAMWRTRSAMPMNDSAISFGSISERRACSSAPSHNSS